MKHLKITLFIVLPFMVTLLTGCGNNDQSAGQPGPNLELAKVSVEMGEAAPLNPGTLSKAVATIPSDVHSVKLDINRNSGALFEECRNVAPGDTVTFEDIEVTAGPDTLFEGQAFTAADCGGEALYTGSTSGVTLDPGDNPNVPVNLALSGATPPVVTTVPATSVETTCADLNSTVNPNGFETVAWFEWGSDTSYGSQTATEQVGNGTDNTLVTEKICGLEASTTYHYRAVASNGGDLVFGEDQTLVTNDTGDTATTDVPIGFPGEIPPTVISDAATDLGPTAATLNATVNPEGASTQVYFEWGTDTTYGNTTPLQALENGFDDTPVSHILSGLSPETEIHFRAVAFNAFGTMIGEDQSFMTPSDNPKEEIEIPCVEGEEPTAMVFGSHTGGCRIDTNSDGDTFTFEASEGDVIRVVTSAVFDNMDPRLELRDPDGILLHNGTCGNRCSMVVEPFNFTETPTETLTKTGTYSMLLSDVNNDEGGAYVIQLERVPPSTTPLKIQYNVSKQGGIDHHADHDFFVFNGAEETIPRITVSAVFDDMDSRLEIYDPDDILLHNGTCGNRCSMTIEPSQFSEVPTPTLTKSGNYHLLISDVNNDEGGGYEINIQCLVGECPE